MTLFPLQQGFFKYDVVDHYAILGCPLDATPQEIRKRYLSIAFRLHPDTGKASSPEIQAQAAKLFSKFVNPAYEVLSREASRKEHLLIATQTARNLLGPTPPPFTNKEVQQLLAAKQSPELVYRKLLTPVSKDLYQDFQTVFPAIARLSEYNLAFLLVKEGVPVSPVRSAGSAATVIQPRSMPSTPAPKAPVSKPVSPEPEASSSLTPFQKSLQRAQEAYDRRHYDQAISELRSALSMNPKDAQAHSLLGMAYLKNGMSTMAKVHIKTAAELAPSDPRVIVAQRELAKQTDSTTKGDGKGSQGGFFGTLFGGKKK